MFPLIVISALTISGHSVRNAFKTKSHFKKIIITVERASHGVVPCFAQTPPLVICQAKNVPTSNLILKQS
jgi:hypothetical protein